jgi:hypothetical protein
MNGKSTWVSQENWLASWPAKSVGGGSNDSGVNQPGVSPSAAVSASRARPCGVCCAAVAAAMAPVRLAVGFVMLTVWTEGSISCWKANSASSAVFQVATPPERTPHIGSAALNRPG